MKLFDVDTSRTEPVDGATTVASRLSNRQIIELALKQYTNPLQAGLRELVITNAADACIRAGRLDADIDVTITATDDKKGSVVTVRDYGCGMSKDFLRQDYFAIGESTAAGNVELSGGFGLGSKAMLAVADFLAVRSVQSGVSNRVIGQLIDYEILVSETLPEVVDEPDGTEVTIMLPSVSVGQVVSIIMQLAVFVGLGSSYRGNVRLTSSGGDVDVSNMTLWSVNSKIVDSKLDHRTDSLVMCRVKTDKDATREFLVGTYRPHESTRPKALSSTSSGVVWNNAYYMIPQELCESVDQQLAIAGKNMYLAATMRKLSYSDTMRVWLICKPSDELIVTSERSALTICDQNVALLVKRLGESQLELLSKYVSVTAGILGEFNTGEYCNVYAFDKLISTRRSYQPLFNSLQIDFSTRDNSIASIALPQVGEVDYELGNMRSFGSVALFMGYWLRRVHNVDNISAILLADRSKGERYGWKVVKTFNSASKRQMVVNRSSGRVEGVQNSPPYHKDDDAFADVGDETAVLRTVVIATMSEKGGMQSLNCIRNALWDMGDVAMTVVYVPAGRIAEAKLRLQELVSSMKINLQIVTLQEFAESLGANISDRSTIVKTGRLIKQQCSISDPSSGSRVRVCDIPADRLSSLLLDTFDDFVTDEQGRFRLKLVPSDGVVILDENGFGTTIRLDALSKVARCFGIIVVGVGTEADSSAVTGKLNHVLVHDDVLWQRMAVLTKEKRYHNMRVAIRSLLDNCEVGGASSRVKSLLHVSPFLKPYAASLPQLFKVVLGSRYDVRKLRAWQRLRRLGSICRTTKQRHVYMTGKVNMLDQITRNGNEILQAEAALRYLLGSRYNWFVRRHMTDSLAVRELEVIGENINRLLDKVVCAALCLQTRSRYPYQTGGDSVLTAWNHPSKYLGSALQSVHSKRLLHQLWRYLETL